MAQDSTPTPQPVLNRIPKPYGIDFAASALQMTLAASAVPRASRNAFHMIAPLSAPALGAVRELAMPDKVKDWKALIAPGAAAVVGSGLLAVLHVMGKRK